MDGVALPWISALTACICLLIFSGFAGFDGLYFHIYRYKLYKRPASRYEHRLHTINVVLYPPLVALLFCVAPRGLYLWLALGLYLGSLAVEIMDVLCEPASRKDLGGLSRLEYLLHFLMAGLRFAAFGPLFLLAAPRDWLPASTALGSRPLWFLLSGAYLAGPGLFIAALHIYLDVIGGKAVVAQPDAVE